MGAAMKGDLWRVRAHRNEVGNVGVEAPKTWRLAVGIRFGMQNTMAN